MPEPSAEPETDGKPKGEEGMVEGNYNVLRTHPIEAALGIKQRKTRDAARPEIINNCDEPEADRAATIAALDWISTHHVRRQWMERYL